MSRAKNKSRKKAEPKAPVPDANSPAVRRLGFRQWAVLGLLAGLVAGSPFLWSYGYRQWQLNRARAELAELKILPARDRLTRLAESQPEHPDVLFWLARAQRRSGELDQAARHFQEALKAGADQNEVQLQLRLMEAQAGRIRHAESFVKEFAAEEDDLLSEEVYEAMAQGFMFTGRFADALHCLNFWIEWRPERPRPRMYLAEIWERTEHWQKAIEEYEIILKQDPDHEAARRSYARCLLNYKDGASALEQYDRLLEKHPDDPELLVGRYKSLEKQGEISKAREGYREMLNRDLTDNSRVDILNGLGKLALFEQKPEEAAKHLEAALEINPDHSNVHTNLAAAYDRLDQPEKSETHRRRAQSLIQDQMRFQEILDTLTRESDDPDLRLEAGELLDRLGLRDQALAWWNASAVLHPGHAPTHRRLEEFYRRRGNEELARKHQQLAEAVER